MVFEPKRGYGAAVWAGIKASDADILAFASADGSDPVEHLEILINPLRSRQADFVLARRQVQAGSMTCIQQWGNSLVCRLIRWRWGADFKDLGPFRALHRKTLLSLNMADRGFGWTVEMQSKVAARGLVWQQIPMPYAPRVAGQSKISGSFKGTFKAGFGIVWTLLRLVVRRVI